MSQIGWRFGLKPNRHDRDGRFARLYRAETGRKLGGISAIMTQFVSGIILMTLRFCLQYVPAQYHTDRVFSLGDHRTLHSNYGWVKTFILPAWQLTQIQKGFVREGEVLTIRYDLAPHQTGHLIIRECDSSSLQDMFVCREIHEIRRPIDGQTQMKQIILSEPGFYVFTTSPSSLNKRVIWRRSKPKAA